MAVVDPSGEWMSSWNRQFEWLEIEVLRSPLVHHPGPSVDALASFLAEKRLKRSGLRYDQPTTTSFRAFTDHLVEEAGLPQPMGVGSSSVTAEAGGGLRVETGSGVVVADRLVVATNPHLRSIPTWVWSLCGRSRGEMSFAEDVDFGSVGDLSGQQVVVVGGGTTAGHLAIGAMRRGATVDLVARRPLETRSFDTCLLYTSPSPRDATLSRMPSSA